MKLWWVQKSINREVVGMYIWRRKSSLQCVGGLIKILVIEVEVTLQRNIPQQIRFLAINRRSGAWNTLESVALLIWWWFCLRSWNKRKDWFSSFLIFGYCKIERNLLIFVLVLDQLLTKYIVFHGTCQRAWIGLIVQNN